ncbi:unnamed protein product [Rotaria socialis]
MTRKSKSFALEIDRAVDQVCSPLYAQMFETVFKKQPSHLSNEQRILLTYYPNEITWYQGNRRQEIIERIRHTHLKWFNSWLGEHNTGRPSYAMWSPVMVDIMQHITNLLFRIDLDDNISSSDSRNEFRQVANTIKYILLSINQSNPIAIDLAAIPLVQELLLILFYFTLDRELVNHLKSLQLVDIMHRLLRTLSKHDEINLQAHRILAIIMNEADIKQLQNSARITAIFISFINDAINGGIPYEARLHNSLRSLKVLTQHDQIRKELIKQKGDSVFLRCVVEDQFNILKAKLPSLEILLTLAFNKDFAISLRDNITFMNHIRSLALSSERSLQLVATALIWKLEKNFETTIKIVQERAPPSSSWVKTKKQYDIMISYSHSDKKLCHHILDLLEKDQLRVWIDSRLIDDVTFDSAVEAIENAEFVFICMSDAYKQSPLCELEATYAVKCQCHIIPLVMTDNYKPDGWLGILTSALVNIDFSKLNLDKAYQELKNQINLIHSNDSYSAAAPQNQMYYNHSSQLDCVTPTTVSTMKMKKNLCSIAEYPYCIDMWTEDHVTSFLLAKELDILLPTFEGMNGRLLHNVYDMCISSQQVMFSLLKEDVARSQLTKTLSLKSYFSFLEEIKVYIPLKMCNGANSTSVICNLM